MLFSRREQDKLDWNGFRRLFGRCALRCVVELHALFRIRRHIGPSEPRTYWRTHYGKRAPVMTVGVRPLPPEARAGDTAELGFKAHPHMLRYAKGVDTRGRSTDRDSVIRRSSRGSAIPCRRRCTS
jgi:hypothetical protein